MNNYYDVQYEYVYNDKLKIYTTQQVTNSL